MAPDAGQNLEAVLKRDLPPLTCLSAFEASARKLSFTKASQELNLTQAAVSFQVRKLETSLGVQLFVRRHRELALTPEGGSLMKAVQAAFTTLEAGKAAVVRRNVARQVTISAPYSLSGKWLVPRLHRLKTDCPKIDLRVDATDQLVDFDSEPVHLAIRYCRKPPADLHHRPLFADRVFAVCSPRLIPAPGRQPHEILGHHLLHDQMTDYTWRDWFDAAGLDVAAALDGSRFSHTGNAIEAAIAGQGIALGRLPLVADDLAGGRLIMPFAILGAPQYSYHIVLPESSASNELVVDVVDWLTREAAATEQALA